MTDRSRVEGTGTWTRAELSPDSVFATATYKTKDGRTVSLPIEVAGDRITGQVVRVGRQ